MESSSTDPLARFSVAGKSIVVTGATGAMGSVAALALASAGANVTMAAGNESALTEMHSSIAGDNSVMIARRPQTPDDAAAIAATAVDTFGGIDGVLVASGMNKVGLIKDMPVEDFDAVMDANLKGVFRMSRAVMRTMMKQRYGRIINITSVVGASGNPGQANYAAAKAGVAGMTRALARELGSRQITVNCVAPGFIATDMTAALSQEQQNALLGQIPLGHLGQVADVAHAVVYLASPQAGYVTGQELHVNGGMHM